MTLAALVPIAYKVEGTGREVRQVIRILMALALGLAVLAGLMLVIVVAGSAVARAADAAVTRMPGPAGTVPKVAFVLLWLLVAGIAAGLIGSG
mgnify:FL=1